MATRKKKTALLKTASKTEEVDLQEVTTRFARVLMLLGADRSTIISAVKKTKRVALPRSVKVVPGPLGVWAAVLTRWADDPRFVDAEGRPRDLPFSGEGESFSRVVELELPNEDPALCRDALLATDSIVRLPSGKLRWLQRYASTKLDSADTIFADVFLSALQALLSCTETNLTQRITKSKSGGFQRSVRGFELSSQDVEEFREFLNRHGMAFLEVIDDWLAQRSRKRRTGSKARLVSPYVGLFLATEPVRLRAKSVRGKRKSAG